MDLALNLDVLPPLRPLEATVGRALTQDDIIRLQVTVLPVTVKKLRDRHHRLAKALASGLKPGVAAAMCGYNNAYVSILQNDPSFKELLTFYKEKAMEEYKDFHGVLADLSGTAAEALLDRLEEDPEAFDNKELLEVVKVTADRTGYGPQSKNLNVNVNVDLANRLERARKLARMEIENE